VSFWQSAGLVLAVLTGGLGLVTAICAILLKAIRFVNRVGRLVEQFLGHGEGAERVPGVVERIDSVTGDVAKIKHQVFPNGGGSLRDAVDELRERFNEHMRMGDGP